MTTGFHENIGLTGEEQAEGYQYKLNILSILTGSTVDEIKSHIDVWMSDRAGDCFTFLDSLDVNDNKALKCCAHLILCINHGAENVFKQVENQIGVHKLLNISAGDRAFSGGSSVHTLGLIAIAKLFSPSHASHSVSLYNEFKQWLQNHDQGRVKFDGFVSNRFGRIAELSREFVKHREKIIQFFEDVVDENSNKLVLAVAEYIRNEWFLVCSTIYSKLGQLMIFPLMELFGIDRKTRHQGDDSKCDWFQVKEYFQCHLPDWKIKQQVLSKKTDGSDLLYSRILAECIEGLERQIADVPFLTKECSSDEDKKLMYPPISNLGCESKIGWLDNRLKISGGTTSVNTLSNKNIVATNKYLISEEFVGLTEEERKKEWKWSRTSEECKEVRLLTKAFLHRVKEAKKLSLRNKEAQKKKKFVRILKLYDTCKKHGGPIS